MYRIQISQTEHELPLPDGLYIVILHAGNKPPHLGMMIAGSYSSLSIKGKDLDVPASALLKNIMQRKICTLFVRIMPPPGLSPAELNELFKSRIGIFPRVDIGVATCLSPILLFFKDTYAIQTDDLSYVYQLLPRLAEHQLILGTQS